MKIGHFFTVIFLLIASLFVYAQYINHLDAPWTRDAQVRAYIVLVTSRVTGPIVELPIKDNTFVKKGQLLFKIDPNMYKAELQKALASQKQAKTQVDKAKNERQRSFNLERRTPGSISTLQLNNLTNAVELALANLELAKATVNIAKLNLDYTNIYAPTDGFITNLNLRVGTQVVANNPAVALIDRNSYWIEGFFKETDLYNVRIKDKASVTLMMYRDTHLEGEVESIGYGIAQQDGSTGVNLLPSVNPNFQWIRLAQRIPVKIKLNAVPDDIELRVGTTASVQITKSIKVERKGLVDQYAQKLSRWLLSLRPIHNEGLSPSDSPLLDE